MSYNVDGFDPCPPESGYCKHGTYVGGIGWDLMCGPCEMGDDDVLSDDEIAAARLEKADQEVAKFDRFAGRLTAVGGIDRRHFGSVCLALAVYAEAPMFATARSFHTD